MSWEPLPRQRLECLCRSTAAVFALLDLQVKHRSKHRHRAAWTQQPARRRSLPLEPQQSRQQRARRNPRRKVLLSARRAQGVGAAAPVVYLRLMHQKADPLPKVAALRLQPLAAVALPMPAPPVLAQRPGMFRKPAARTLLLKQLQRAVTARGSSRRTCPSAKLEVRARVTRRVRDCSLHPVTSAMLHSPFQSRPVCCRGASCLKAA
mmetsp:Transcript_90287/g.227667  ORF Transcript_90287/g.227667 Transcript_90287/m.227667 type:complete len:207 (-) Transcript_90287:90-710(-)